MTIVIHGTNPIFHRVTKAQCFRALLNAIRPILESGGCGDLPIPDCLREKCQCKRQEEHSEAVEQKGCVIRHCLIANLGNVRSRYPQMVDDFVDECQAISEIRRQVEAAQRPPSMGAVFAKIVSAALLSDRDFSGNS